MVLQQERIHLLTSIASHPVLDVYSHADEIPKFRQLHRASEIGIAFDWIANESVLSRRGVIEVVLHVGLNALVEGIRYLAIVGIVYCERSGAAKHISDHPESTSGDE